ncbi:MAG: L-arabinose isomerase, partial [Cyclobacteriaceae bacterium]
MINLKNQEIWFVTGSQHLYGQETLDQVAEHATEIAEALAQTNEIPVKVIFKPVLTTTEDITQLCLEANSAKECIGLIAWMHTFSPAKMWINGLKNVHKPLLHLHTQYNRDIPWSKIDMNFMNLNQSAHGGREFGFITSRMGIRRKVVAGHWKDETIHRQLGIWTRCAGAWSDWQGAKFARFGDNMRQVAVTEGNKVSAEIQFGYSVNGYGMGDLATYIDNIGEKEISRLVAEYDDTYQMSDSLRASGNQRESLREAAKIELGLKAFLEDGNFKGFTDTFEDLHGLNQLPGIAIQRLMAKGYGFGAEGDWKTAALVRAMKVMGAGLKGGNSFMEDYTYHFDPHGMNVLGSHMLEICESIANGKPSCEIHPLGIGGKADPVRLVFDVAGGSAINVSIIDIGNRFRLLANEVEAVNAPEPLPKLPVARVLWKPKPNLRTAATAWILAGGAHHTCYSQSLTAEYLEDFAEMAGIEYLPIDNETRI